MPKSSQINMSCHWKPLVQSPNPSEARLSHLIPHLVILRRGISAHRLCVCGHLARAQLQRFDKKGWQKVPPENRLPNTIHKNGLGLSSHSCLGIILGTNKIGINLALHLAYRLCLLGRFRLWCHLTSLSRWQCNVNAVNAFRVNTSHFHNNFCVHLVFDIWIWIMNMYLKVILCKCMIYTWYTAMNCIWQSVKNVVTKFHIQIQT